MLRKIRACQIIDELEPQREEFTAHGFAGCLHKPFTVSELLHELNMEDKGMEVMEVSETSACPGYKFSSLTAFSVDDPEAAKSILESFCG